MQIVTAKEYIITGPPTQCTGPPRLVTDAGVCNTPQHHATAGQ